ncbi:vitamin K epoxide reductase family protein [Ferrimicrobium sp.]|uniref:vitamin K epoxide reductase family protein n=1 Tax=Ferrimicrobium sp. TaxID=2926050 RepID=UPI0026197683|nr:vitamin K epoxide reductase family protein [Ferrimicrobium sp.]
MQNLTHSQSPKEALTDYPLWVIWLVRILALGALGVAIYLTIAHYDTKVSLLCPDNATINCQEVTTSPQSMIVGIPVAVLGLAYYVIVSVLAWWPRAKATTTFELIRLIVALGGVGFILYLVYAEIVEIGAICLWCTSVHLITILIFLLLLYAWMTYRDRLSGGLATAKRDVGI